MAELKITRCKVCTSPLKAGSNKCGKCGAEHSIEPAIVNPLRFTPEEVQKYRAAFEEQVQENPNDSNALFATGLTYLGLKNYELADEALQKAVKQHPENPDVYYYCALCMFKHHSVANLSKEEMERIEEWLQTATQIQPKRKYLILQMILRQGMTSMGLNLDTYKEMPAELLEKARVTQQEEDELFEIEQHVLITDETTKQFLSQLSGNAQSSAANGKGPADNVLQQALEAYDDICQYPTARDRDIDRKRVEQLNDEAVRQDCLAAMYPPAEPEKVSHPSVMSLLWKNVKRTILYAVLFFVAVIVAETGFKATTDYEYPAKSVEARVAERLEKDKADGKKTTKAERKEYEEAAIAAFEKDTAKIARREREYTLYGWATHTPDSTAKDGKATSFHWGTPTDEDMAQYGTVTYCGIRKGAKGIIGIILWLICPALWLILLLASIIRFVIEWRRADKENAARRAEYKRLMNIHETRPTVNEYKKFCQLYLGPNVGIVPRGDMVALALKQAGISEEDVANGNGKIYFFASFVDRNDYNEDSVYADDVLHDIVIDVCVALHDSIVCLNTKDRLWDTTSNQPPIFEEIDVMYDRISEFRPDAALKQLNIISDGRVTATVAYGWKDYPSLFQYQSTNINDDLTYSRTRTSNFAEFKNSLFKMHTAYVQKKK